PAGCSQFREPLTVFDFYIRRPSFPNAAGGGDLGRRAWVASLFRFPFESGRRCSQLIDSTWIPAQGRDLLASARLHPPPGSPITGACRFAGPEPEFPEPR